MTHSSPYAPDPFGRDPAALLRGVHVVQRLVTAATWVLCGSFVWAGLRAWSSGAGVTMLIVGLVVCIIAALGLPRAREAIARHLRPPNPGPGDDRRHPGAR